MTDWKSFDETPGASVIADVKNVAVVRDSKQWDDYILYAERMAAKKREAAAALSEADRAKLTPEDMVVELGVVMRDNGDKSKISASLLEKLCNPEEGVTVFIQYHPSANGGGLSGNVVKEW
nr:MULTISPECIES: hypothetical protein [Microbacterium]